MLTITKHHSYMGSVSVFMHKGKECMTCVELNTYQSKSVSITVALHHCYGKNWFVFSILRLVMVYSGLLQISGVGYLQKYAVLDTSLEANVSEN